MAKYSEPLQINELVAAAAGDTLIMEHNDPPDTPMEQDTILLDVQIQKAHSATAESVAIAPEDTQMIEQDTPLQAAQIENALIQYDGAGSSDPSSGPAEDESGAENADTIALRKAVATETAEWAQMVRQQKMARLETQKMGNREGSSSSSYDEFTPALLFCKDKAARPESTAKNGGISSPNVNEAGPAKPNATDKPQTLRHKLSSSFKRLLAENLVGKEMQASITQLHFQLNKIEELVIQHRENTFTGEDIMDAIMKLTQAVLRVERKLPDQKASPSKGNNANTTGSIKNSTKSLHANRKTDSPNKRPRFSNSSTSSSVQEPADVIVSERAARAQGVPKFATHREACQSVKIEELEEENENLLARIKHLEKQVNDRSSSVRGHSRIASR
ncbi:hypothetical protein OIDMADRAFT_32082 [Oidiodendron maius Zn]|uniref:Uncharacterized protein n=1 Tax=Oidiodendron maius (strain Zn) TaxID=913774 RepID=A0A0C3H4C1_OIDMZ|nr:hypothetical protein OIDMADRAFT_32082 [Oidiodendron maius Zn]